MVHITPIQTESKRSQAVPSILNHAKPNRASIGPHGKIGGPSDDRFGPVDCQDAFLFDLNTSKKRIEVHQKDH